MLCSQEQWHSKKLRLIDAKRVLIRDPQSGIRLNNLEILNGIPDSTHSFQKCLRHPQI